MQLEKAINFNISFLYLENIISGLIETLSVSILGNFFIVFIFIIEKINLSCVIKVNQSVN